MKMFNWIARKFKDWTKKKEPKGGIVDSRKGPFIHEEFTIPKNREIIHGGHIYINLGDHNIVSKETMYKAVKEALKNGVIHFQNQEALQRQLSSMFPLADREMAMAFALREKKQTGMSIGAVDWGKARKRKTRKKTRQK